MNTVTIAKSYVDLGFSVIPICKDGSKKPAQSWKEYQDRLPTEAELEQWFEKEDRGIGVVTGKISGNLLVIDFDQESEKTFPLFWDELKAKRPEIVNRLVVVKTPRPGIHVWVRQSNPVEKNTVLARCAPPKPEGDSALDSPAPAKTGPRVRIETRGEGGYVIAPNGPPEVHPNKKAYEIIEGEWANLQPLTADEVDFVLAICKSLNKWSPETPPKPTEAYKGLPRPGDVYNLHADFLQLLLNHGWSVFKETSNGVLHLNRPGKNPEGESATLGFNHDEFGCPLLFVFSSNAPPFEPSRYYTAFDALALLEFDGDYSQAATDVVQKFPDELKKAQAAYTASHPTKAFSLPDELPYKPFPVDKLPKIVRDYVVAHAEAIGIDAAYVAVPMLSVLAAAIGGSRRIKIKNEWCEPSIIWTVTIGSVSAGKSPGFEAARKPMIEIEKKLEQLRKQRKTEYDQQQKLFEAAKNVGGKGIAKPKLTPYNGQVLINDCTMEALAPVATHNIKLLLAVDELAAFFKQMDQYRPGRDKENWLSFFNGKELNVNRKTDNQRIWVPNVYVSVTGTTQPDVANDILYNRHALSNGLSARFLVARPPNQPLRWTEKEVPHEVNDSLLELVKQLYELEPEKIEDTSRPIDLPCDPEAKELFASWYDEVSSHTEGLSEALKGAWGKLTPVAARLGLIFSIIHQVTEFPHAKAMSPVDKESMQAGIDIARWFGYELERNCSDSEAIELDQHLQWILQKHPEGIEARILQQGRRTLRERGKAKQALEQMVKRGYGQMIGNKFVPNL